MAVDVLTVVVSYVLGAVPFAGAIAARWGHDPTREGSGNPGASNVYRTAGRAAGAAVLACDGLKGAVAAGAGLVAGGRAVALAAGAAAVAGHVFPPARRRGGKGVATTAGAVAVVFPLPALAAAASWMALAAGTRVASVASLGSMAVLLVGVALAGAPAGQLAGVVGLVALVVARHRGNIARLARGAERPLRA